MSRRHREFGVALVDHVKRSKRGKRDEVATLPQWGSVLDVPALLDLFLTNGRKDIGVGEIVVPDTMDFHLREVFSKQVIRCEISDGPRFEGKRLLKVLDWISGPKVVTHIDIACDTSHGVIAISNVIDWPITFRKRQTPQTSKES